MTLESMVRKAEISFGVILGLATAAVAQNQITIHAHDTETGRFGPGAGNRTQIVATNLGTGQKVYAPFDTTTGTAQISIPSGPTQIDVEWETFYKHRDTINVNGSGTLPLRYMIFDYPTGKPLDFLSIGRKLSKTQGQPQDNTTLLRNRRPSGRDIRIWHVGGVPSLSRAAYDSAKANMMHRSNSEASLLDIADSTNVGITAIYVPFGDPNLGGGLANHQVDAYNPDGSVKHSTIWFAYDRPGGVGVPTYLREFGRSLQLFPERIVYPDFVMTSGGTSVYSFHPVEGKWIEIQFKLPFATDMSRYKERVNQISGVKLLDELVASTFHLEQNYPNPFNPLTTISFSIPFSSAVKLTVFNLLGQQVTAVVNENLPAGTYATTWDAASSPSGVYFCRMQAGTFSATRRMALVR